MHREAVPGPGRRRMPLALALGLAIGVAPGAGCGEDTVALDWQLRFEPPAVERPGGVVLARVLSGGCTGEVLAEWEVAREATPEASLRLDPQRIGLWARAADSSCTWYARGCVEAQLPLDGAPLVLTLLAEEPDARCPGATCDDGRCFPDGGVP